MGGELVGGRFAGGFRGVGNGNGNQREGGRRGGGDCIGEITEWGKKGGRGSKGYFVYLVSEA